MASTIRELCREEYQKFVREADLDPELKRSLKTHERVPAMIDNLARDLANTQAKKETIILAVRDVSRWFVNAVQLRAKERVMSEANKLLLKKQESEQEQFRKDVETYDEKGAMHVIKESESFEEIRSKIGLRPSDYESGQPEHPTREVQETRKADKI